MSTAGKMMHTPGPWQAAIEDEPISDGVSIVGPLHVCGEDGPSQYIATLHGYTDDFIAFNMANAHLIAAAPDLLEALKACLEELRLIRMKDCGAVYDIMCRHDAEMAIAKAEGRTNA